jgi:hypothetical protein
MIMKELMNIMLKDIQVENFSRREMVIYGVVYPAALVVVCMIASIF